MNYDLCEREYARYLLLGMLRWVFEDVDHQKSVCEFQ